MAKVTIEDGNLSIEIEGLDKLWALKSRLSIPVTNVRRATPDPRIASERKGWRGPGTYVPRMITAGTFHQDAERVFWDVHDPSKAIVIELDHESYRRLVIEVDDPKTTAETIEAAVHRR
jgi:hypothetical protein